LFFGRFLAERIAENGEDLCDLAAQSFHFVYLHQEEININGQMTAESAPRRDFDFDITCDSPARALSSKPRVGS
jgi:hypothetical protein